MKFLTMFNVVVLIGIFFVSAQISAKTVEFIESIYAMQAPEEIVAIAQKAAALVGFDTAYEVAVPKKPGIQINPWNKFAYGAPINPQTNNPYIVVNQQWFSALPEDQQLFLLGRIFVMIKQGIPPLSQKLVTYAVYVFSVLLALLIFWLLRKTKLVDYALWIRLVITFLIVIALELIIVDSCELKIKRYFGRRHDRNVHEMVIEKTANRDAGIKALQHFHDAINVELSNGELFFKPYADLFGTYANELKK